VTRDEFNDLLGKALEAILPASTGGPYTPEEVVAMTEEAQLLDAEATAFADAVDRDAKRIPYGSAVVLEGPRGIAVVQAADYTKTISYWWTVVGGKPDRIVSGPELMQVLAGAANRGASTGA